MQLDDCPTNDELATEHRKEHARKVKANKVKTKRQAVTKPLTYREWLPVVSPTFIWTWRQTIHIIDHIEKMLSGEIEKLMIFLPPRHTKSETVTVRLPAYLLEQDGHQRIIVGAYNQTLVNKFSRKTRRIATSRIPISKERTAVEDWETLEGGGLRAVGVGGGVTGQGGNWIIIDDPVKNREEANSETYREKCWDWYTDDLYTRREPGCKMILIMTRWHQDDLAGRILESEDGPNWTVINLPALAETNDPLGRKEGEALCPERYNEKALLDIKRVMGASFQALYQQRPSAEEGEIFKRGWWQYYREAPKLKWIMQSWDTAFKKGAENDYSVCTTWGCTNSGYYILDRWKAKVDYPTLKKTAQQIAAKWHPRTILIEDKASGQSLIQDLKAHTTLPIIAVPVDSDKVTRAHAVTSTIEAGNVYLPEGAEWLADFIDEHATFPNGSHDDEVDSVTQFLNYVRRKGDAAFKDFADAAEALKGNAQHVWRQQANPEHWRCDQCGVTLRVAAGETAQGNAEKRGWKECKPS